MGKYKTIAFYWLMPKENADNNQHNQYGSVMKECIFRWSEIKSAIALNSKSRRLLSDEQLIEFWEYLKNK